MLVTAIGEHQGLAIELPDAPQAEPRGARGLGRAKPSVCPELTYHHLNGLEGGRSLPERREVEQEAVALHQKPWGPELTPEVKTRLEAPAPLVAAAHDEDGGVIARKVMGRAAPSEVHPPLEADDVRAVVRGLGFGV